MDPALLPWTEFGWGGIALLAVLLIIRGDLVPRKVHEEVKADRDRWRDHSDDLARQNSQLIAASSLAVRAVEDLKRTADQMNLEGGPS